MSAHLGAALIFALAISLIFLPKTFVDPIIYALCLFFFPRSGQRVSASISRLLLSPSAVRSGRAVSGTSRAAEQSDCSQLSAFPAAQRLPLKVSFRGWPFLIVPAPSVLLLSFPCARLVNTALPLCCYYPSLPWL